MEHAIKVNVAVIVTDDERRRIRRGYLGRAGLATRKEIRVWVDALVKAGLDGLPELQTKPKPSAAPRPASRFDRAKAAPEDAVCARCRRPKHEHGRMALSCPPTSKSKGTFQLAEGAECTK